jgi:hypothetical protein
MAFRVAMKKLTVMLVVRLGEIQERKIFPDLVLHRHARVEQVWAVFTRIDDKTLNRLRAELGGVDVYGASFNELKHAQPLILSQLGTTINEMVIIGNARLADGWLRAVQRDWGIACGPLKLCAEVSCRRQALSAMALPISRTNIGPTPARERD